MNAPAKAGRREWIGLAVIALPCLLYSMDLTVLHLAVPRLTADLQPTSAQLLWIIDIYGFFVAGSLITAGTLGDRIGRRKVLLIGAALFGAASTIAAFSSSAEMLIATRALLGLAGATVAPSTMSLIRHMFPHPHQRTTAISVWIMAFSLGGAIGPIVGGVMLQFFWWGSVFLLNVPVMLLILVLGPKLLPEFRDPNTGKLDPMSAAMSMAAVLAMIYGLKTMAQDGVTIAAMAAIVIGAVLGWSFVQRQLRLAHPLLDLTLFRIRAFTASLALYGGTILIGFGGFFLLPQYLQLVRGLSPLQAGVWALPWSLAFVAGSALTPPISRRMRPATLMAGGLVLTSVAYALLTQLTPQSSFAFYAVVTFIVGIGSSPVFTLTNDVIIGSAPPERAGAASGISETCAEFGGALGIAIFGTLGVLIYRSMLGDILPAELPPQIRSQTMATLGGAVAMATQLPPDLSTSVVDAARSAFIRGLQVCSILSAAGTLALAVLAAKTFRQRPAAFVIRGDGDAAIRSEV
jgi:MFS transporter, DHA2 family, multidrug resistance protein